MNTGHSNVCWENTSWYNLQKKVQVVDLIFYAKFRPIPVFINSYLNKIPYETKWFINKQFYLKDSVIQTILFEVKSLYNAWISNICWQMVWDLC